ncbi:hypothetical protein [Mucilaginibacter myungsuensis]|uniref:Uncharacterized protein n=1 Tax=Mucilaginibacter myungsuensis TaxID=649104 RepID=A0A929L022_9SPHI|nr:hypothetical protein [Mucilaginibacter myungsuensis]MBE9663113.1 hypothetical protein [Mucilaginibacter myungsuensis]MDN3598748.1 hypothetical protein [Mucilaginibacter myungsuensis]
MFRNIIDRFSRWFNDLRGDRPVFYFFGFCLVFLALLWLCVRYVRFDGKTYNNRLPGNIGKPSGLLPTDSLTLKKH